MLSQLTQRDRTMHAALLRAGQEVTSQQFHFRQTSNLFGEDWACRLAAWWTIVHGPVYVTLSVYTLYCIKFLDCTHGMPVSRKSVTRHFTQNHSVPNQVLEWDGGVSRGHRHCCEAHAKINRKMGNSTPYKIVTHENLNMKLGTLADTITSWTSHTMQILVEFGSAGASPQQVKYNPFVTFLTVLFFFSILDTGQTVGPIFTFHGSNDVYPRKVGPFGDQDH